MHLHGNLMGISWHFTRNPPRPTSEPRILAPAAGHTGPTGHAARHGDGRLGTVGPKKWEFGAETVGKYRVLPLPKGLFLGCLFFIPLNMV